MRNFECDFLSGQRLFITQRYNRYFWTTPLFSVTLSVWNSSIFVWTVTLEPAPSLPLECYVICGRPSSSKENSWKKSKNTCGRILYKLPRMLNWTDIFCSKAGQSWQEQQQSFLVRTDQSSTVEKWHLHLQLM